MKPNEECEEDLTVFLIELFCQIGMLIVEGRLPEDSERGRVEGPHCSHAKHSCIPTNSMCCLASESRQTFKSKCVQRSPLCINISVQHHDNEEMIMLEKWRVELVQPLLTCSSHVNKTLLLQALRSYLHFSQLSAWLSHSQGLFPKRISYRIMSDDEKLGPCDFSCEPDSHVFPISLVTAEEVIQVSLLSLPRGCNIAQSIFPHSKTRLCVNNDSEDEESDSVYFEKDVSVIRSIFIASSKTPPSCDGLIEEVCLLEDLSVRDCDTIRVTSYNENSPLKKKQCTSQLQDCEKKKLIGDMKDWIPLVPHDSIYSSQSKPAADLQLGECQELEQVNTNKRTYSIRRELKNGGLCGEPSSNHSTSSGSSQPISVPAATQPYACKPRAIHRIHRSLTHNDAVAIFQPPSGLPISSSPAPLRRSMTELNEHSANHVTSKHFDELSPEELNKSLMWLSKSAPAAASIPCLRVNFEESVLNRCMDPLGTVQGFKAELGASGSFCPQHVTLPVEAQFFQLSDDNAPSPYMGFINLTKGLSKKGYHIPKKGTIQLTLFNPYGTVVKVFVTLYNFTDMPSHSQTFLRQRVVSDLPNKKLPDEDQTFLHYLMHLRFATSKSSKLYLHTDIRLIFPRQHPDIPGSQLKVLTNGPTHPKYTLRKNTASRSISTQEHS